MMGPLCAGLAADRLAGLANSPRACGCRGRISGEWVSAELSGSSGGGSGGGGTWNWRLLKRHCCWIFMRILEAKLGGEAAQRRISPRDSESVLSRARLRLETHRGGSGKVEVQRLGWLGG